MKLAIEAGMHLNAEGSFEREQRAESKLGVAFALKAHNPFANDCRQSLDYFISK